MMIETVRKKVRVLTAVILLMVLGVSSICGNLGAINAATNGIVKGPDTTDKEDYFSTKLVSGENVTIKIVNSRLTIKVESTENVFTIGNISKTTDAAVVNEKDGLLHILTLGGVYYVYDLYTGVQIIAHRNSSNGKYCSVNNSYAYMVYGRSLINNIYFYESITSNSLSRERLMTRNEFNIIINGGDPSSDETIIPTQTPTVITTLVPTQVPTKEPTIEPTPTVITTLVPTQVPTKEPTIEPTPTVIPTLVPTQVPTKEPTIEPTPTVIPTLVPTQVPTKEPTIEPTPTVITTLVPTQVPTKEPTIEPTQTPMIEINNKTEFDFDFWWNLYLSGTITWEQFSKIVWEYNWKVTSQVTEKSTTYYFYDDDGRLIKAETVTVSDKTELGTGSGSATEETNGKADIDINVSGNGSVNGNINNDTDIKVNIPKETPSTTVSKTKKVTTTYHVKRKGKKVSLTRTVAKNTGVICSVVFDKKKGIAKFDSITYKGIKYVGYTSDSRQIILLKKNGKALIIPRAKGKINKTYTAKTLKGTWKTVIENTRGLAIRVSDGKKKVMGVKNAQPKMLK